MTEPELAQEQLETHIEAFDHVSVAVKDIETSQPLISLIGGQRIAGGESRRGGFAWAQFSLPGGGKLELIEPVDADPENFLRRFINTRGEGLHHLTFKVHKLDEAVAAARRLGFTITGFDDSHPAWKEAFVHPRSAHGVLIQLAEFPEDHG
ncbi:MAG: methylmalonyl-CoA epimerase [Acidimicrobiia bacterium]|nr:MAG: methylmalonyl-CoA epimerase [Acidimicrobiia bacterium]